MWPSCFCCKWKFQASGLILCISVSGAQWLWPLLPCRPHLVTCDSSPITAESVKPTLCRVVIYLQKEMSGDTCLTTTLCPAAGPKPKTCSFKGGSLGNKYVRLNVGGSLYYTTVQVLTRHDTMLKAMFSGRMEVLTDKEGKGMSFVVDSFVEQLGFGGGLLNILRLCSVKDVGKDTFQK